MYSQKYFDMIDNQLQEIIWHSIENIIDFIWTTSNEIQKDIDQPCIGYYCFSVIMFLHRMQDSCFVLKKLKLRQWQ